MDKDRLYSNRRDFLRAAGLLTGSALLTACAPKAAKAIAGQESTLEPADTPPVLATPTGKPTEAPTLVSTTIEQRFIVGSAERQIDLTKTPFSINAHDLRAFMGHTMDLDQIYTAKIPLLVTTEHIYDNPEQVKIFEHAAKNHGEGNPFWLIASDRRDMAMDVFHSAQWDSPGDLARQAGGWVMNNPDTKDQILGQKVSMNFNGFETNAEIVYVTTVPAKFWDGVAPWGNFPNEQKTMYALTDKFEVPDEIRNNSDPNSFYLMVVGCQSKNGSISPWYNENIVNRSIMVLKITT